MEDPSITYVQSIFSGSYDFTKRVRAQVGLKAAWTETDNEIVVGNDNGKIEDSGVTDLFASTQFWMRLGDVLIVPQLNVNIPMYRINEDDIENPPIGEGVTEITAGAWGILMFDDLRPFAYGGFGHRDNGRSNLFRYNVGLQFKPGSWYVEGAIRGYESVSNDDDDNELGRQLRDQYMARVNGGSLHLYGVNPGSSELAIEGGLDFGYVHIFGGGSFTINGTNSAEYWTGMIGVAFRHRPTKVSSVDEEVVDPANPFAIPVEEDKSEEELFLQRPEADAQPPPPEPSKVRRKVRKRPSVDRMLHETEKLLEKKD